MSSDDVIITPPVETPDSTPESGTPYDLMNRALAGEDIAVTITLPDAVLGYFGPADSWESVAARFGVTADELYLANQGLGGCFSMQMVPAGSIAKRP